MRFRLRCHKIISAPPAPHYWFYPTLFEPFYIQNGSKILGHCPFNSYSKRISGRNLLWLISGARSARLKPSRPLDRYHRSSTERDEDSDRRGPDLYRDRRDDSRRYRDDYDRTRYLRDGGRGPDRRDRYRDPDEPSYRREVGGGRHERTFRGRDGALDGTVRYREETFRRGGRQESDFEADSFYGDEMNR